MMPKSGARFERCGDDAVAAPQPPIVLTAASSLEVDLAFASASHAVSMAIRDGAPLGVDRPPRA